MTKLIWQMRTGVILICVSIAQYAVHYFFFKDLHFLEEYTLFYFAFLPIEAIFVTLILDQLMEIRARKDRFDKLNMVIGVFFSEVGTRLLSVLSGGDPNIDDIRGELIVGPKWSDEQFNEARKRLKTMLYIDVGMVNLKDLKQFLIGKRNFLVRLLENPALLEHESFTGLLRAVFHLTEELEFRKDLDSLPDSDYGHIRVDLERVYVRLFEAWLDYMKYMKNHHPYLYSLAMRTNPFDANASPVVK